MGTVVGVMSYSTQCLDSPHSITVSLKLPHQGLFTACPPWTIMAHIPTFHWFYDFHFIVMKNGNNIKNLMKKENNLTSLESSMFQNQQNYGEEYTSKVQATSCDNFFFLTFDLMNVLTQLVALFMKQLTRICVRLTANIFKTHVHIIMDLPSCQITIPH